MTTDNTADHAAEYLGALAEKMEIAVLELSADAGVATMPVAGNTQPLGLLHGGASAVLAETVASRAAAVHAGPEGVALGVDLNITHHRSAATGIITATATATHLGRSVANYEIALHDEDHNRIASARLTCAVRPKASVPLA